LKIFAPVEAKMMNHDKKNEKMKKTRGKLQLSIFWKNCATGSKNDGTMI